MAMDVTGGLPDMLSAISVDKIGKQDVSIKSTGHETVCGLV